MKCVLPSEDVRNYKHDKATYITYKFKVSSLNEYTSMCGVTCSSGRPAIIRGTSINLTNKVIVIITISIVQKIKDISVSHQHTGEAKVGNPISNHHLK